MTIFSAIALLLAGMSIGFALAQMLYGRRVEAISEALRKLENATGTSVGSKGGKK